MAQALMIAQMGFAIASASYQAKQQAKLSKMEMDAYSANNARAQAEYTRQQEETNRGAAEQKSDRMRAADADLAMIRVASAEGFGMGARFTAEAGYLLGVDLSRIEANREGKVGAIQSQKGASFVAAQGGIQSAKNKSAAANDAFILKSIGSGVQIAGQYESNAKLDELLKNKVPGK